MAAHGNCGESRAKRSLIEGREMQWICAMGRGSRIHEEGRALPDQSDERNLHKLKNNTPAALPAPARFTAWSAERRCDNTSEVHLPYGQLPQPKVDSMPVASERPPWGSAQSMSKALCLALIFSLLLSRWAIAQQ